MNDPAISANGLRKAFGKVTAVDGLSFTATAGEVLGLLGPNGSGKTTTVGILSTALRPDSGSAIVSGFDVVRSAAAVRASIGFAGQYAAVDPALTGRENLVLIARLSRVPRRSSTARADELLERFGLVAAAGRLVRTYSGGMRRRLDLAAALVRRPPVVFLDEPTTGLDPAARAGLWGLIRDLALDGATVLLTTQYLEEADALASRVVILNQGRVAGTGTPAELKRQAGSVVFELTFTGEAAATAARAALDDAAVSGTAARDGALLRVRSTDGSGQIAAVLRALNGTAPDPVAVTIRQPTLDDVFLALTADRGNNKKEMAA